MFQKEIKRLHRDINSTHIGVLEMIQTINQVGPKAKQARLNTLAKLLIEGNCSTEEKRAIQELIEKMDIQNPEIAAMVLDFHAQIKNLDKKTEIKFSPEAEKKKRLLRNVFESFFLSPSQEKSSDQVLSNAIPQALFEVLFEETYNSIPNFETLLETMGNNIQGIISEIHKAFQTTYNEIGYPNISSKIQASLERNITAEEKIFLRNIIFDINFEDQGDIPSFPKVYARIRKRLRESPDTYASDIAHIIKNLPTQFAKNFLLICLLDEGFIDAKKAIYIIVQLQGSSAAFQAVFEHLIFPFFSLTDRMEKLLQNADNAQDSTFIQNYLEQREKLLKRHDGVFDFANSKRFPLSNMRKQFLETETRIRGILSSDRNARQLQRKQNIFKALFTHQQAMKQNAA